MKKGIMILMVFVLALGLSMKADAELQPRGVDNNGIRLIYDKDLNITWYDYTNSYNTWDKQRDWVSGLSVSGGDLVGVYDDWRLPIITAIGNDGCNWAYGGTDCGYNVDTSTGEMAHLFHDELGNQSYYDETGTYRGDGSWGLQNTGPFQHLQSGLYWSGTEYAPAPDTNLAWLFNTSNGDQGYNYKDVNYYAIAVRPGDVSVAVVPEPGTMLLLGSGLVGLAGTRRLFRRRHG